MLTIVDSKLFFYHAYVIGLHLHAMLINKLQTSKLLYVTITGSRAGWASTMSTNAKVVKYKRHSQHIKKQIYSGIFCEKHDNYR